MTTTPDALSCLKLQWAWIRVLQRSKTNRMCIQIEICHKELAHSIMETGKFKSAVWASGRADGAVPVHCGSQWSTPPNIQILCNDFPHIDPGLAHVTRFGQWNINKHDARRGLISTCILGLVPPPYRATGVWPPWGWKTTGRGSVTPAVSTEPTPQLTLQLSEDAWASAGQSSSRAAQSNHRTGRNKTLLL